MKRIRHFFPKGLFGRFLLIVIMPIILAQLVATYMFYYRHWDNVAKDISLLIVQEIKQSKDIVDEVVGWGGGYEKAIKIARLETGYELNFEEGAELKHKAKESYKKVYISIIL